jgi:hypothetical protein
VSPAVAQEYLFAVPEVEMLATVNPDSSVKINYDFTFQNSFGAHPIDIVDIGTPHAGYQLGNVRAWINGQPLSDVRVSEMVKPGFEVHLGGGTIPPGGSGRFRVEFTMPDMVYQDTTRSDYASLRITPTWFGDRYVNGTTNLKITIRLPKSVKPEEVLHQGLNFTQKAKTDIGALVGWDFPGVRFTGKHDVAVSFPKRDLQRVIHQTAIDLLVKWFSESPGARLVLGIIYMVLLGFLFFRFSGGTGVSVYVFLAIGSGVIFYLSPGWHLTFMPIVVVLIGLNEWLLGRGKSHYMPPIAQVEGGGIKRGLTAPEAAVLLELPVAKVLSLVIFGMLKKGILRQVQADPLLAAVNDPFLIKTDLNLTNENSRTDFFREAAVKQGILLNNYEQPFLYLIEKNPSKPVREINFSVPLKMLIQGTAERMKGFDLSDTKDYYQSIIHKACQQAAAIGDIPQREKTIDRNFEWILMDNDYPTVFSYGPYWPVWTRGSMFPTSGGGVPSTGGTSMPGTTSFGDVASSFSGWAENTMGSMASAITPGSLSASNAAGGFLDLSGVDHVTGEFFKALGEAAASGGGGGGGGCACAGCACACACAGGGR